MKKAIRKTEGWKNLWKKREDNNLKESWKKLSERERKGSNGVRGDT